MGANIVRINKSFFENCQHAIWINNSLKGVPYGSLRSLEQSIIRRYNANPYCSSVSEYNPHRFAKWLGLGTNKSNLRLLIPSRHHQVKADVFWSVLMGPENFEFDINRIRLPQKCIRILYLFDTFPSQYKLVKYMTDHFYYDLLISSFQEALAPLSEVTERDWYFIPQAIPRVFLSDSTSRDRKFAFVSFGRKVSKVDDVIAQFCDTKKLAYVTTDQNAETGAMDELERYHNYADILNKAVFNISWGVRETNPLRSCGIDPVTARWIEASAAGNVIVGTPPVCSEFADVLPGKTVYLLNQQSSCEAIYARLEKLWSNRDALSSEARKYATQYGHRLTWDSRLSQIESIAQKI